MSRGRTRRPVRVARPHSSRGARARSTTRTVPAGTPGRVLRVRAGIRAPGRVRRDPQSGRHRRSTVTREAVIPRCWNRCSARLGSPGRAAVPGAATRSPVTVGRRRRWPPRVRSRRGRARRLQRVPVCAAQQCARTRSPGWRAGSRCPGWRVGALVPGRRAGSRCLPGAAPRIRLRRGLWPDPGEGKKARPGAGDCRWIRLGRSSPRRTRICLHSPAGLGCPRSAQLSQGLVPGGGRRLPQVLPRPGRRPLVLE